MSPNAFRMFSGTGCRLLVGMLALAAVERAVAEVVSQVFFDPEESAWGTNQEPVGTDLYDRIAHPGRWIDFDGDGLPELEIRGKDNGEGVASINIKTFGHARVMSAAKVFYTDPGGYVLPLPRDVPIGADAPSSLFEGLSDVGWHRHDDFGYYPNSPYHGGEDYFPPLLVSSGGMWGGDIGGYFGLLAGTPPFDGLLYIGVRFGDEGSWRYAWLHMNILGGWEGFISGWAYETELNKPILAGAIPEPAAAASLAALAALGVAAIRRRGR